MILLAIIIMKDFFFQENDLIGYEYDIESEDETSFNIQSNSQEQCEPVKKKRFTVHDYMKSVTE